MAAPILIFGATGGIGEALARRLAAAGHSLFLTGRRADAVADLAGELGAGHAVCDVMEPASIQAAVSEAAAGGEGLAGLAYCVGSIVIKPLKQATAEEYVEHVRLNAVGAALAVQAAQPALAQAHGSVVLFSTVAVDQGFPNHSVISMAKGAVQGLTLSLAAELAPAVRVNAIAPSLTRTRIGAPIVSSERMEKTIAGLHAIPRIGEPEDQAALAAFLLGPDSGWITGQVIGVDGGRSTLRTKA
jgi:NAD(P)-dependent dehydrogenase (short-subunit alcohol dehydrogenase family)